MGILRRLAACVLVLLIASPTVLASGFENTGLGTTAIGMGGAFRAVADDWTAAYYNPAGYAFIMDNQLGADVAFLHYRHEIVPNYLLGGEYEAGILNDRVLYNKHEVLNKPSGGFLLRAPVGNREMVLGFSMYQPFDNNIEWTLFQPLRAYNENLIGVVPEKQYRNNLDVVAFQLTAATAFGEEENFSIGVGLQLLRADLIWNDIVLRDNPRMSPISDRPRDRIIQFTENDGYGWGFGINAGLMYRVSESFNVALSANVPFDITVDGDGFHQFYMPFNDPLSDETIGTLENLFVGGSTVSFSPEFEADIPLPPSFGFGLAWRPVEQLLVAVDAAYTLWSQYEGLNFTYSGWNPTGTAADPEVVDFFTSDLSYPTEWTDAGKIALGLNYQLNNTVALLAGASGELAANDDNIGVIPQFVDPGQRVTFSLGTLLSIERWVLGFATSYITYEDQEITELADLDGDGTFDNFPAAYEAETFETALSFTYRF